MSKTIDLADGRKLTIQQPSILQEARIVRAMGDSSSNAVYMSGYVLPAVYVTAIDGEPVIFPNTQREVEGMITRLGREGLEAVIEHLSEVNQNGGAQEESEVKN